MKKMEKTEKVAKVVKDRLAKAAETLTNLGREEIIWKRIIANAVLDVLAETGELPVDAVLARIAAHGNRSVSITGTALTVEAAKLGSETATAHLLEAIAKHQGKAEQGE